MENKISHTPTPYVVKPRKDGLVNIYHGVGVHCVALCVKPQDAEYIVRAVNNHDALLETLENAVDDLNFDGTYTAEEILKTVDQVRNDIRQAIAAVEGGK